MMTLTLLPAAIALLMPALPASPNRLVKTRFSNKSKPNYHFMNDSPQVIPVSINWASGRKDQPLAWQPHANNASLAIKIMDLGKQKK